MLLIDKQDKQDGLTGLPDKERFFECCHQAIRTLSERDTMLAIHLIYIENLKDIIMEHGLHVGEGVLKAVANRLYGLLSDNRVFARLEGETFGLLQLDVDHVGHVLYVSRRVFEILKDPVDAMGEQINIKMNIGIALYPDHGEDLDDLYHNASLALEKARQKENNQCVIFDGT